MLVFQMLSAGNIGQLPAPGTLVDPAVAAGLAVADLAVAATDSAAAAEPVRSAARCAARPVAATGDSLVTLAAGRTEPAGLPWVAQALAVPQASAMTSGTAALRRNLAGRSRGVCTGNILARPGAGIRRNRSAVSAAIRGLDHGGEMLAGTARACWLAVRASHLVGRDWDQQRPARRLPGSRREAGSNEHRSRRAVGPAGPGGTGGTDGPASGAGRARRGPGVLAAAGLLAVRNDGRV